MMASVFWEWWQHLPGRIDPVLFSIGGFQLRYYGLMYIVAFGVTYGLLIYRSRRDGFDHPAEHVQDLMVWLIVGTILGGRLGYVIFYDLAFFMRHPLKIILPVDFADGLRFVGISGMSYHGGMLGVVVAGIMFCRRQRWSFWETADFLAPAVPLGYTFGRIGNFINGELYGRATTVPWGMYFPLDPARHLRHPSQLYEALGEGLLCFAVLWGLRNRAALRGSLLGLYLVGYGLVRFVIEYFRQPDAHLMFVLGPLTMGQVLCGVMIAAGVVVALVGRQARRSQPA
jgi:phosphatidylglycerol:prolipoprotein diacylglycerol transferase